jgi:hypothetical protein
MLKLCFGDCVCEFCRSVSMNGIILSLGEMALCGGVEMSSSPESGLVAGGSGGSAMLVVCST